MTRRRWLSVRVSHRLRKRMFFALVLGLSDGILNSLTLASAAILKGSGLDLALGLRVGIVALVSAWFTLFVAEYAQYRMELADAERQLMFTRSGRLATTTLGAAVIRDAAIESAVAAVASFVGASMPLFIGACLPGVRWMALAASITALGAMGEVLAVNVGGRKVVWIFGLVVAGIVVTVIGLKVDLI